jgi:hypothetical protein
VRNPQPWVLGSFIIIVLTQGAVAQDRFLRALAIGESNCNDSAVGDHGLARGRYQIHRVYWQDGTTKGGVHWDYDRWVNDPVRSAQVVRWYLSRYAGPRASTERMFKIHHALKPLASDKRYVRRMMLIYKTLKGHDR